MKKAFKILFFISVIFTLLFVLTAFATGRNTAMGIIGGADGPTSIILTSTPLFESPWAWILSIAAVTLFISSVGWAVTKTK